MKHLRLEGNAGFSIEADSVKVRVERISNNLAGSTTGTLRVSLWALEAPAEDDNLKGHVVATRKLDPLEPRSWRAFDETLEALRVPKGYYLPAISLEERDSTKPAGWSF